MEITVHTQQQGDGTGVSLCQSGYQEGSDWNWYYEVVRDTWPEVLRHLKGYVEKNN